MGIDDDGRASDSISGLSLLASTSAETESPEDTSKLATQIVATICARRSIRREFTSDPVPESVVDDLISCGLSAPSSKNAQPWRLHVVTNRSTLRSLANTVQSSSGAESYVPIDPATGLPRPDWPSSVSESADVLREVALGIFVENRCEFSGGRATIASAKRESIETALVGYTLEVIGLGAAIQNMWLAAQAHGLLGVFMGDILIAEEAIRDQLGIAGDLVGVLALGYSTGVPWIDRVLEPDRSVRHR